MDKRVKSLVWSFLTAFLFLSLSGTLYSQTASQPSNQSSLSSQDLSLVKPPVPSGPALVGLPSVAPVVEKSKAAVVNIITMKTTRRGPMGRRFRSPSPSPSPNNPFPPDSFFEDFFGFPQAPPRVYRERALGSGFIFDKDGYIITNNHVVEGADEIKIVLDDKQEIAAEIVGRDPKTDLALIKLSKPGVYPFITFGDSEKVQIGDWLVAIGNPFGLDHTVTTGILSARGRSIGAGPYDDFLQTDASINPGNSGGPLLNLNGEVVGINTMIIAGGNGIGFAIPSKLAEKIVAKLRSTGHVERGWIGVVIQPVTPEIEKSLGLGEGVKGALIGQVLKDTPAEKAGLKHGDIVTSFDGRAIGDFSELSSVVADTAVGKTVNIDILRDNKKMTLKITVDRLEDESDPVSGAESSNADLGLTLREITPDLAQRLGVPESSGLLVEQVVPSSLADVAGLRARDVILEVDRKEIKTQRDFNAAIRAVPKGQPALLWVRRGERTIYCPLNLE